MSHTALLYFVGPAGAGKSTLVASFQDWMTASGYEAVTVNLDPGAETVPYEVGIDVRERFTLASVMDEYSLGPNGAQIVCSDLLALEIDWLADQIKEIDCDYILVDAPGQTELFLYREASNIFIRGLSSHTGLVMLFDPLLSRTPSGFVTQLLLASAAHLRFPVPLFPVLSKCDLIEQEQIDLVVDWASNLDTLEMSLDISQGMEGVLSSEMLKVLRTLTLESQLTPTSSKEGQGMEDLYSLVQSSFAGGEDIEAHRDSE